MNNKGQALFEFVIVLHIFIFLIILGFQVFKAIDSATLAQKRAQNKIFSEIEYRANGGQDLRSRGVELVRDQSDPISTGGLPMLDTQTPTADIQHKMGMCRSLSCGQ